MLRIRTFLQFLKTNKGIFRAKPFLFFAHWWPAATALIFGSYFYSGDRKPLGDLSWVWYSMRLSIAVFSIICLILRNKAWPREWTGHLIAIYVFLATASYTITTDDKGKLFQGEVARTAAFGFCLYALTFLSFYVIDQFNVKKSLEQKGIQLGGE